MTLTNEDLERYVKYYCNIYDDSPASMAFPIELHTIMSMAKRVYEMGIKEGMRREHAMWQLAKIGQEIETKDEYCPHGRYINYSCNDCDAEEHADRVHSYGE